MYSPILNSLYIRKNIYRQQNIFVCLCCIETDKISVRRRAESKRFGEKKAFLDSRSYYNESMALKKVKMILKWRTIQKLLVKVHLCHLLLQNYSNATNEMILWLSLLLSQHRHKHNKSRILFHNLLSQQNIIGVNIIFTLWHTNYKRLPWQM